QPLLGETPQAQDQQREAYHRYVLIPFPAELDAPNRPFPQDFSQRPFISELPWVILSPGGTIEDRMDKSCANHPESMALATCKACDKSICLMCVVDEKEGTFCSSECHAAFVEGREVPKYVDSAPAAEPASVASGSQKIESIFDDGP